MMWSSDSDRDEQVAPTTTTTTTSEPATCFPAMQAPPTLPPRRRRQRTRRRGNRRTKLSGAEAEEEVEEQPAEAEAEDVWRGLQREAAWPRRVSRPVVVAAGEEGSPDGAASAAAAGEGGGGMGRARSLTDDDLEELKGCVDLGFGFSYNEIPELCSTLPALELCYSMSQRFLDEHQQLSKLEDAAAVLAPASPAQPVATNWKISSPGDSPDEVKARLKYWAQAVACTVKLCT